MNIYFYFFLFYSHNKTNSISSKQSFVSNENQSGTPSCSLQYCTSSSSSSPFAQRTTTSSIASPHALSHKALITNSGGSVASSSSQNSLNYHSNEGSLKGIRGFSDASTSSKGRSSQNGTKRKRKASENFDKVS